MPIDIRQLQAKISDPIEAHIEGEAEPLIFRYHTHRFTNDLQRQLVAKPGLDILVEKMSPPDGLMTEWDLKMDGQPWPLTQENLSALGIITLTAIAKAIVAHQTGQDEDRKNSDAGSTTATPALATVPTTSPSSASPVTTG